MNVHKWWVVCSKCDKSGHNFRECQWIAPCSSCGKIGHKQPECQWTPFTNFSIDCLTVVLSFSRPLEIWHSRLTCSFWRKAVPSALKKFTDIKSKDYKYEEGRFITRIVELCPNIKRMKWYTLNNMTVIKIKIKFSNFFFFI